MRESKDWLRPLRSELYSGGVEPAANGRGFQSTWAWRPRGCAVGWSSVRPSCEWAIGPADQTCLRAIGGDRSAGPPRAGKHLPAPEGPREARRNGPRAKAGSPSDAPHGSNRPVTNFGTCHVPDRVLLLKDDFVKGSKPRALEAHQASRSAGRWRSSRERTIPAGQMSTPNTCSSFAMQHWATKRGVVMQPRKDWRFVRDFYNDREYGQGVFKLPIRFRIQVPE